MDNKEVAKEWFVFADYDLKSAEFYEIPHDLGER